MLNDSTAKIALHQCDKGTCKTARGCRETKDLLKAAGATYRIDTAVAEVDGAANGKAARQESKAASGRPKGGPLGGRI